MSVMSVLQYLFCPEDSCLGGGTRFTGYARPCVALRAMKTGLWTLLAMVLTVGLDQLH